MITVSVAVGGRCEWSKWYDERVMAVNDVDNDGGAGNDGTGDGNGMVPRYAGGMGDMNDVSLRRWAGRSINDVGLLVR